jgi:hypothetical protein
MLKLPSLRSLLACAVPVAKMAGCSVSRDDHCRLLFDSVLAAHHALMIGQLEKLATLASSQGTT